MPKRRKTTRRKTTHRRRARVGKIGGDVDIMGLALIVGGAVAGKILSNKLETSTNSMLVKVAPFAPLALGIALPMFIKNVTIMKLAMGMVASGGIEALGSNGLKVISGMEVIGYPGGYSGELAPYSQARVAGPAGNQGLAPGTRSNFSGSRQSQVNTIAGVCVGAL